MLATHSAAEVWLWRRDVPLQHWEGWAAAIAGILGSGGAIRWWFHWREHRDTITLDREKAQDAVQATLREELREDLKRLDVRVESLEHQVAEWRGKYWEVFDQHSALKTAHESLSRAHRLMTEQYAELEKRYLRVLQQMQEREP